ncbi:hypothetical protein B0A55_13508 [Friedmanniomyces simplex]|uniref:Uncharacterized protein n=1 Tax=Friedmanniomyces simplex TaxID=329884 RepID=A0A4U0WVP3_9PEZI|nr:hypothetical protein B0A55_13508 [Friedmanniomyces simplex]
MYREGLNDKALDRSAQAEKGCERSAGNDPDPTQGMTVEINDVRRMLIEGVSTSEMKMVVAAMAKEFRGTGHCSPAARREELALGVRTIKRQRVCERQGISRLSSETFVCGSVECKGWLLEL